MWGALIDYVFINVCVQLKIRQVEVNDMGGGAGHRLIHVIFSPPERWPDPSARFWDNMGRGKRSGPAHNVMGQCSVGLISDMPTASPEEEFLTEGVSFFFCYIYIYMYKRYMSLEWDRRRMESSRIKSFIIRTEPTISWLLDQNGYIAQNIFGHETLRMGF